MQESQMSLEDLRNNTSSFDPTVTHDDFLDQLLSGLQPPGSWSAVPAADAGNKPPLHWDVDHFNDHSAFLSSKLRQHQITTTAASSPLQPPIGLASAGESALFQTDNVDDSCFKSPIGDNNNSIQSLFHGFTRSLTSNQTQQIHNNSTQSFGSHGAAAAVMGQVRTGSATAGGGGGGGGAPSQPRQRVRARRGQATDPHSIAERLRRERIAERMKALQELVPNANKADKASMLDDIVEYVKFLQLQVKILSMSRLGNAAGATLVPEVAKNILNTLKNQSRTFCIRKGGGGRSSNAPALSLSNDTAAVTENQVVKLMEEDMGSAMQYLQGKGLCLMPISLATTISAATCHPSGSRNNHPLGGGEGGGPSSPNMSVSTIQSAVGVSVKDSP